MYVGYTSKPTKASEVAREAMKMLEALNLKERTLYIDNKMIEFPPRAITLETALRKINITRQSCDKLGEQESVKFPASLTILTSAGGMTIIQGCSHCKNNFPFPYAS